MASRAAQADREQGLVGVIVWVPREKAQRVKDLARKLREEQTNG